jgi:hypothetical protein
MGDATRYQGLVEGILEEYASIKPSYGDVENEVIFIQSIEHYLLMTFGWHGQHRIHGCMLHVDIKGEKIWIQHDGTEEGIANRLVAAGCPGRTSSWPSTRPSCESSRTSP